MTETVTRLPVQYKTPVCDETLINVTKLQHYRLILTTLFVNVHIHQIWDWMLKNNFRFTHVKLLLKVSLSFKYSNKPFNVLFSPA
jgi:hypothetical protein